MIKKILGICICLIISISTAHASDLSAFCAEPHDLSFKTTRFFNTITGFTPLSHAIANSIIKKELTKATGSKGLKVKMKSYSANDLAAGRFKSLRIYGKNLNFDGVYVSNFEAKTICDFNYIKATPKTITFVDNFPMNYSMTISDEDLRKTVLSEDYLNFLHSLNLKFKGVNLFELKNVDVKLDDNKFYFVLHFDNRMFNYSLPLNLNLAANMEIQNSKITVTEVESFDNNKKINLTRITNLLNLINPLNYTVDMLGNKNSKLSLNNLNIKDDKLVLDGTIFIPKNSTEIQK